MIIKQRNVFFLTEYESYLLVFHIDSVLALQIYFNRIWPSNETTEAPFVGHLTHMGYDLISETLVAILFESNRLLRNPHEAWRYDRKLIQVPNSSEATADGQTYTQGCLK